MILVPSNTAYRKAGHTMLWALCDRWSKNITITGLTKKHEVHGVAAGIHSKSFLHVLASDKWLSANKYWHTHCMLIALGLSPTDPRWRELHDNELWGRMWQPPIAWVIARNATLGFGVESMLVICIGMFDTMRQPGGCCEAMELLMILSRHPVGRQCSAKVKLTGT
jgi:hypothetical protein